MTASQPTPEAEEPSTASESDQADLAAYPSGGFRSIPASVWAATAVFGLILTFWTILAPAYRSPDESQHVNSVLRIAEGGGWPRPGKAFMSEEVMRSRTLIGFSNRDDQRGNWDGANLLPGVRRTLPDDQLKYFALYTNRAPTGADDRLPYKELTTAKPVGTRSDQMTQHPPLYYAIEAGLYNLFGVDDWRFDRALAFMRMVSALMVVGVPLMAYLTAYRLSRDRTTGSVAAFLPLAVPQLAHIGASVSNDVLVIALGSLLITMLSFVLTGARSWKLVLGIGLVVGLACFTKGTLVPVVPVAALALFVGLRKSNRLTPDAKKRLPLLATIAAMVVGFVFGGWWYVLNYVRYGTFIPSGYELTAAPTSRPRQGLLEYAGTFWDKFTASYWGNFGLLELPMPAVATTGLSIVGLLLIAAALILHRERLELIVLLLLPTIVFGYLFFTTFRGHRRLGIFPGIQGRYLFSAIVILSAVAAIGLVAICSRVALLRRIVVPVSATLSLTVAAGGMAVAFGGFYVDGWSLVAEGWYRMIGWSPWPAWSINTLAVVLVVASAAAIVLSAITTSRQQKREQESLPDPGQPALV